MVGQLLDESVEENQSNAFRFHRYRYRVVVSIASWIIFHVSIVHFVISSTNDGIDITFSREPLFFFFFHGILWQIPVRLKCQRVLMAKQISNDCYKKRKKEWMINGVDLNIFCHMSPVSFNTDTFLIKGIWWIKNSTIWEIENLENEAWKIETNRVWR